MQACPLKLGGVHLRGVRAGQDLAGHHARDGDNADDIHLVQDGRQRHLYGALQRLLRRLPAAGAYRQLQLYAVSACRPGRCGLKLGARAGKQVPIRVLGY